MSYGLRQLIKLLDKNRDDLKEIAYVEVMDVIRRMDLPLGGRVARKVVLPVVGPKVDDWIDTLMRAAGWRDGKPGQGGPNDVEQSD
jgi:hypothetical protein